MQRQSLYWNGTLGAVSIKRCLTGLGIPMLKIRRSGDRLIFNMGIPIPGKDSLYTETGPRSHGIQEIKAPPDWLLQCCPVTEPRARPSPVVTPHSWSQYNKSRTPATPFASEIYQLLGYSLTTCLQSSPEDTMAGYHHDLYVPYWGAQKWHIWQHAVIWL